MTPQALLSLIWQTVVAPREVAKLLLAIKPTRDALWLGFALVITVNALVFGVSNLGMSGSDPLSILTRNPINYAIMTAGSVAAMIVGITMAGRVLGGRGAWQDIAVVMIWLQVLRASAQFILAVMVYTAPGLLEIASFVMSVVGVWILVNLVQVAHQLTNMVKALMVVVMAVVGTALIFGLLASMLGLTGQGLLGNV